MLGLLKWYVHQCYLNSVYGCLYFVWKTSWVCCSCLSRIRKWYQFFCLSKLCSSNFIMTSCFSCTEVCEPVVFSCSIQVIGHFDGCKADLVVCDGAPDGKENVKFNFIISWCTIFKFRGVLFNTETIFTK